jgi:LysR family transcriptional activator of nhaA
MSHINYNHLYYFWHVYKEGSVVGAAEALFLTPQTITGQIKALEERLQGNCLNAKGGGWSRANWASWYSAMRTACSR